MAKITSQQVEDAWQAYRATQLAACGNPALLENEYFLPLQETAYARFLIAFEAMEVDPAAVERYRRSMGL